MLWHVKRNAESTSGMWYSPSGTVAVHVVSSRGSGLGFGTRTPSLRSGCLVPALRSAEEVEKEVLLSGSVLGAISKWSSRIEVSMSESMWSWSLPLV